MKLRSNVAFISYAAIMAAVMLGVQVAMAGLPNIELVSFLVIFYTLLDRRLAATAIGIFIVLEGVLYGFHLWWLTYLYVWYVLFFVTAALKRWLNAPLAALVNGAFGLVFGTLTSIPYFILLGPGGGVAYIIAGIPFDIAHCIGNTLLALLLFAPMMKLAGRMEGKLPACRSGPRPKASTD